MNQRGWYWIQTGNPVIESVSGGDQWVIAYWDGVRWYEPGKVESDGQNHVRYGPMLPFPSIV